MSLRPLLGLVIAAAATLSGCGETDTPPPPPSTGPTTTSSGTPVPSVSDPVDLTPYARHPCTALTMQQVTDLGIPSEEIEEIPTNEDGKRGEHWQCEWSWDDRPPELQSRYDTYWLTVYVTGDPLAKAYQDMNSHRGEKYPVWSFEEHTVRGLPAVARFTGKGEHACKIVVGTGNGQGFELVANLGPAPDLPSFCPRLLAAAELIVDTARR